MVVVQLQNNGPMIQPCPPKLLQNSDGTYKIFVAAVLNKPKAKEFVKFR